MLLLFWLAALVVAWAHVGYPLLALLRARTRPRPWREDPALRPSIVVVIAARDEAAVIEAKLRSVLAEPWPERRREVVVVDDGSTDDTAERAARVPGVRVVRAAGRGKAAALSTGVADSGGDVIVFTDARQPLLPGALAALVAPMADPEVGAVSGELELAADRGSGLGIYRRLDDAVRRAEALAGSSVGVTGALWAVRRARYVKLPEGLVLDDLAGPLAVARAGARVVVAPRARVLDLASPDPRRELDRRVRTLAGNLQLVRLWPWTVREAHPLRFEFLSHKLARIAAAPALVVAFLASLAMAATARVAWAPEVLAVQVVGYGLAAAAPWFSRHEGLRGAVTIARLARLARSFALLHVAALLACAGALRGEEARWKSGHAEASR